MAVKKKGRTALLLFFLCLMFLLTGCRARVGGTGAGKARSDAGTAGSAAAISGSGSAGDGIDLKATDEIADQSEKTQENPEAPRKEYDENAPAEMLPGAEKQVHGDGEGNGTPHSSDTAKARAAALDEDAEETVTRTVALPEAERMGVSPDAGEAESAMVYYTVLLKDRLGSLFECKRLNAYWETSSDRVTVHRSSKEHGMLILSGVYDVSARLLEENLRVDDGWVVRKDPQVIVKVVSGSILGRNAIAATGAKAVCGEMMSRPGWAGIDAVKNRRILVLSEELLEAPYLETAAEVMIAKCAYPDLFEDVDASLALEMLCSEAVGAVPPGTFFYDAKEE